MSNILQIAIVIMFSLGVASAMIGDPYLCFIGLTTALGCVVILTMRDES